MDLSVWQAFPVSVGVTIKRLRAEKRMTQVVLAQRAQYDKTELSRLERGLIEAQGGTLKKLADALGVSLEVFLPDTRRTQNDAKSVELAQKLPEVPSETVQTGGKPLPKQEGARMNRWAVKAFGIVLGLDDDDQPQAVAELRRWSAERVTRKEPPESPAGRAVHRKRR